MRRLGLALTTVPLVLVAAWACAALWIDGPHSRPLAGALVAGFALAFLAALAFVRPYGRGLVAALVLLTVVLVWWMRIPPSNDRDWLPDVAELPRAQLQGNLLTIENVRDFVYHGDENDVPRWETATFDLSKLEHLDMFFSFWGPTDIAHTIMSWSFADGSALAVSIETRKEKGETYSALLGFFRQFEL